MENSMASVSDRARALLKDSFVIDCRDPTFLLYPFTGDDKPAYWESLAQSGINTISVDANWVDFGLRDTAVDLVSWYKRIREHNAILVESTEDIVRAKKEGRISFILSSQSADAIEDQVGFVEVLFKLGMRMMQFAYQRRSMLGEGVGEKTNIGLSQLGYKVLAEMNRVGMIADLAHATEQTMRDMLDRSAQPMVNSHSCARALVDNRRNTDDEILRVLAKKNGVYCVSAYSDFLKENGSETGTSLEDWGRHVDYLCNLIGPEHVGIGFDVGEGRNPTEVHVLHSKAGITGKAPTKSRYVTELTCRANFPLLVEKLISMGYSDGIISKILGGNLMRLFKEVWGK